MANDQADELQAQQGSESQGLAERQYKLVDALHVGLGVSTFQYVSVRFGRFLDGRFVATLRIVGDYCHKFETGRPQGKFRTL